jgi:hypothetical protein
MAGLNDDEILALILEGGNASDGECDSDSPADDSDVDPDRIKKK